MDFTGRLCILVCCVFALQACPDKVLGDTPADDPVLSIPRAAEPPTLDGRLDEPQWKKAGVAGPFVGPFNPQASDHEGRPEYRTEARLLWDADTLYVAFICRGPQYFADMKNHDDPLYQQDVAEIFIDVAGDCMQYAEFQASPLGITADWYHIWAQKPTYPADRIDWSQDKHHHADRSWNSQGFKAAGGRLVEDGTTAGWIVEMAIPMAELLKKRSLPAGLHAGQTINVNLLRYMYGLGPDGKRLHGHQNWSRVVKGCPHVSPTAMRAVRCENIHP